MRDSNARSFRSLGGVLSILILAVFSGSMMISVPVYAARCDCGQPLSSGASPSATDCLLILQLATSMPGIGCGGCDDAVCRPGGGDSTMATDALRCLQAAVGITDVLECPAEPSAGVLTGFEWSFREGAKLVFGPIQYDVPLSPHAVLQTLLVSRCASGGEVCESDNDCSVGDPCTPTCDGTGECEFIAKPEPRRCTDSMHVVCATNADCPSNEECQLFFASPTPVFHPAPICTISYIVDPEPGTINMDTGHADIVSTLRFRVWLGAEIIGCPICGTLEEDLQLGDTATCTAGLREGQPCTVHGKYPGIATTSWDCPPNPSTNITGSGILIPLDSTTGTIEKIATLPCGGFFDPSFPDASTGKRGFCNDGLADCATNADCMRCEDDLALPCTSNADCGGTCLAAPDQPIACGNYCHCGTCSPDNVQPCASDAECGAGNVCETSRTGRVQTEPNGCSDSICGAVEPEQCCQDATDPRCLSATTPQKVCSENLEFECPSEETCSQFGYGQCNAVTQGFRCFENRFSVTGEASVGTGPGIEPTLVVASCSGESSPSGSPGLFDQVARTPGPVSASLPSVFLPCVCGNGNVECDEPCDDGVNGSATCTPECSLLP